MCFSSFLKWAFSIVIKKKKKQFCGKLYRKCWLKGTHSELDSKQHRECLFLSAFPPWSEHTPSLLTVWIIVLLAGACLHYIPSVCTAEKGLVECFRALSMNFFCASFPGHSIPSLKFLSCVVCYPKRFYTHLYSWITLKWGFSYLLQSEIKLKGFFFLLFF